MVSYSSTETVTTLLTIAIQSRSLMPHGSCTCP
jgi:hypothetical protein